MGAHDRPEAGRVADEVVLLVDRDGREGGRQADRVTAVGQAAVEHPVVELLGEAVAHRHRAERQVARGQALGHRHEVGGDVPVVHREPAARPAEARHDLVGDHQDPVPIADLADAGDVPVGRDEDAVRADDGLEEDRRDRVRAFVADHVLQALEALRHRAGLRLTPAMRVRIADDPDEAGLVGPAPRVAGQGHGAKRRAVVRAIAGEDLVASGRVASELDGVLDGLGAAEREEDLVHVAGQDLGELGPEPGPDLGRERRLDVLQLERLCRDGVDDPSIAVADVDRHQLAVEVEDPLTLGRVEVDALGVIDGDRVDGPLDRPREDRVLLGEGGDLRARHRAGSGADTHRVTSGRSRLRSDPGRPRRSCRATVGAATGAPLQHIRGRPNDTARSPGGATPRGCRR